MSRVIAVIATERTGTNYFCDLMIKSLSINGMYEIFHPDMPYGLNDVLIAKALNKSLKEISALDNKLKAKLVKSNPKHIIDVLVRHEQKTSLFKIFPGHLNSSVVKSSILENPDVIKVIIDRSPLDVYISQHKAGSISKWGHVDTTDIKINLDRCQFDAWFKNRKEWYDVCSNTVENSNQKYVYINYSDIESRTPEELVNFFIQLMAECDCKLIKSDAIVSNLMKKQDNSQSPAHKVKNWPQFERSFPGGVIDSHYFSGFLNENDY